MYAQDLDIGVATNVPIGFPFRFYCGTYDTVTVNVNGRIFFGATWGE